MAAKISELKARIQTLEHEIYELRHVGQQFSNIAHNWGQEHSSVETLRPQDKTLLRELREQWDRIPRSK